MIKLKNLKVNNEYYIIDENGCYDDAIIKFKVIEKLKGGNKKGHVDVKFLKFIENNNERDVKYYNDEDVMVFADINPVRPTHILVVPKEHISDFPKLSDDTMNKLKKILLKMTEEKGLAGKGYRVVLNGGGAQVIDHLHFHLMGPMGLKVGW